MMRVWLKNAWLNFSPSKTTLIIIHITYIQHVDIKEIKILIDEKSDVYIKWAFENFYVRIQVQIVTEAWR